MFKSAMNSIGIWTTLCSFSQLRPSLYLGMALAKTEVADGANAMILYVHVPTTYTFPVLVS